MAFYDEDNNARPAPVAPAGNARTLGFFTGIIAIIVGVNGLVTSCAKERSDLETAQRQYILAEESYWQRQYAELANVLKMTEDTNERLFRLQSLYLSGGLHVFEPERAGVTDEDRLTTTFDFLFLKFTSVFEERGRGLSDKEIDELGKTVNVVERENNGIKDQRKRLEGAREVLNPVPNEDQPANAIVASAPAGVTTPPTLATPRPSLVQISAGNREGYDFDIFWCEVGDKEAEQRNFVEANAVGQAISTKASIKSQMIGRVRVRALPAGRQGFGYPTPSEKAPWNVRYDSGDVTEKAIADEINEQIKDEIARRKLPEIKFGATASNSNTKYYISLFVCHSKKATKTEVKKENGTAASRAIS